MLDQNEYRILQFSSEGTFEKIWEIPSEGTSAYMWRAIAASDSFLYASTSSVIYQFFPDGSVAQWNFGSCMNGLAVNGDGNLIVSVRGGSGWHGVMGDMRIGTKRKRTPPPLRQRLDVLPPEDRGGIWELSSQGEILKHWEAPAWPIALGKDGAIYAVEPDSGNGCLRIQGDKIELSECKLGLQAVGTHRAIAASKNGNVFINDNSRVVEVDEKWKVLRRWCELGPAHDPLNAPRGVCVDGQENLYVVDYFKKRVLKFHLGGS